MARGVALLSKKARSLHGKYRYHFIAEESPENLESAITRIRGYLMTRL